MYFLEGLKKINDHVDQRLLLNEPRLIVIQGQGSGTAGNGKIRCNFQLLYKSLVIYHSRMLGVEYHYFTMQLFKVVVKEQESYNRKRITILNNLHSDLRIDF